MAKIKQSTRKISQMTGARWGVGPSRHVAKVFVDRKKEASKRACRGVAGDL